MGKKPKSQASIASNPKTKISKNSLTTGPRQLKAPAYKSLRLSKKIKNHDDKKILGSFQLLKRALQTLIKSWKLFLGIIIIYGLLSIVLAGSLSAAGSSSLDQTKQNLSKSFGSLSVGITLYADIAGNSATGSTYESVIIILISLAMIWALREVYAEGKHLAPRIREAFYNGMAPLIQFILVLLVLIVELIPLTIGAVLYAAVVNGNIVDTAPEKILFGIIFFLLAVASFYLLTGSAFAPYIVTLKGMSPVKALKASASIVRSHRPRIFLKLLFIILALIIIAGIIIVPLAIVATPAAPYVFFILSLFFLAIFHSYIYALYRELI